MDVQLYFNAAVDYLDFHLSSPSLWKDLPRMWKPELEQMHVANFVSLQRQSWRKATRTVNNRSEWACAYLWRGRGITAVGRGGPLRACRLLLLIRSIVPVYTEVGWPSLNWDYTSHVTHSVMLGLLNHKKSIHNTCIQCLFLSCATDTGPEQILTFSYVRRSMSI